MLFIGINEKNKSYHVSPSIGCFNDEELKFIEESIVSIWRMTYDLLIEHGINVLDSKTIEEEDYEFERTSKTES